MYVYKITNNINGKAYIGMTNDYKKRWGNECSYPANEKRRQAIQEAIHKYGKENFTFEVLHSGLSIEEAEQLEGKYAEQYNTYVPNGYNVAKCGSYFPSPTPMLGERNGMAKITDEEAQYILDHRDQPMYTLYDSFSDKISYDEFKAIYYNQKFSHLSTTTEMYPYNLEFSNQFTSGNKLEYPDVIDIRTRYNNGEYWEDVYKDYKHLYEDKWTFWNIYYGNRYSLVMPEVFTEENRKKHTRQGKTGVRNGRAKLGEEDVITIRHLHSEGVPNTEIYKLYPQITPTSIRNVINNKTWTHLL